MGSHEQVVTRRSSVARTAGILIYFSYRENVMRDVSTMMTYWRGSAFRITGPLWEDPPVLGGFYAKRVGVAELGYFYCRIDVRLNKLLNKQSIDRWIEISWYSHYSDVIMGTIASQITSLTIVHSTVYSDADQRKHQSSASLAFVRRIHRWPVNSPQKWPVTRKKFRFDDVIIFHDILFNLFSENLCQSSDISRGYFSVALFNNIN